MRTANAHLMKEMNRHLVRRCLMAARKGTKQRLAKLTKLSQMTVGSLITEMVADGEVAEGTLLPSSGGRPSVEYCYCGAYAHAAVVYEYQKEKRTFVCLRVFNLLGETVWAMESFMDEIVCASFEAMLDAAFQAVPAIKTIVFGLPGVAENDVILANDYQKLIGAEFLPHYRSRYAADVVFVNDVNAAALGYYRRLESAREVKAAVAAVYFPRAYDPGMGLVLDGKIYSGRQNFAGEFGNLPFAFAWNALDYENKDVLHDAIGKLLAVICCTVAPERMILYGDFLLPEDAAALKRRTQVCLNDRFQVELEVAADFSGDFERGLQDIALRKAYRLVFGTVPSQP